MYIYIYIYILYYFPSSLTISQHLLRRASMLLSIQVRRDLAAGATAFDGALDEHAFPLWKAIALRKLKVYTAMA